MNHVRVNFTGSWIIITSSSFRVTFLAPESRDCDVTFKFHFEIFDAPRIGMQWSSAKWNALCRISCLLIGTFGSWWFAGDSSWNDIMNSIYLRTPCAVHSSSISSLCTSSAYLIWCSSSIVDLAEMCRIFAKQMHSMVSHSCERTRTTGSEHTFDISHMALVYLVDVIMYRLHIVWVLCWSVFNILHTNLDKLDCSYNCLTRAYTYDYNWNVPTAHTNGKHWMHTLAIWHRSQLPAIWIPRNCVVVHRRNARPYGSLWDMRRSTLLQWHMFGSYHASPVRMCVMHE